MKDIGWNRGIGRVSSGLKEQFAGFGLACVESADIIPYALEGLTEEIGVIGSDFTESEVRRGQITSLAALSLLFFLLLLLLLDLVHSV